MPRELLVLSDGYEPWIDLLKAKFPVLTVGGAELSRALQDREFAVIVLSKKRAQDDDWALCKDLRSKTRALIAVVQQNPLEPPVRMAWVDDMLDYAAKEDFILRINNLLRIAEANSCYFNRKKDSGEEKDGIWARFFGTNGFMPPFMVTGSTALDPAVTRNFVRLLTSLLNTTATFVPVSPSPPWLAEDPALTPVEYIGMPYCRTAGESPVRIGGVSPCRYARWLASVRSVIERRAVLLPCPGGLFLYACPVCLEFYHVLYPLGVLVAGVGDVPLGGELVRIGQRLKISVPLLRERAGIARAMMRRSERVAAYQLIESAADYLAREVSYRYNTAFQEYCRAGVFQQLERTSVNHEYVPAALEKAEKLAAMGKLATGLIHEIRNPLTSVRGFIQLLAEKKPAGDREREYLDVVLSEVDRVNEIIRSFLFLARSGEFRPVKIDLDRIIRDILLVVENQAALKGIEILHKHEPGTPEIQADPEQIKQVLLNLIQNAFQAMPFGGKLTVALYPESAGDQVILEVADTGVGIPPEHFSRLGEAFFTTKEDGTGLGLAISYRIIEDHRGRITVHSEEGKGTRFLIKLPVTLENGDLSADNPMQQH
ncbi:MAG: ATP-binding protein [Bacillota bacterium]